MLGVRMEVSGRDAIGGVAMFVSTSFEVSSQFVVSWVGSWEQVMGMESFEDVWSIISSVIPSSLDVSLILEILLLVSRIREVIGSL